MADVDVKLILFAKARELVGASEVNVRFPQELSSEHLKSKIIQSFPVLDKLGGTWLLALNEAYIDTDRVTLNTGDTLAVIPPISGG
ncbi:molybdopterin synthase sulfur carrier subunit-like [Eurytemora carolleeae]|uniref:molybdopterin synthase sulfur carrier subunit-like n=1 Tax=Eurytemora carolleeae TaxID=1294199 RepID=UPI000C7857BE|nr:molybdopterin synthase sulfur carrier subunit-like [Eurytemora carolleeae]XP_023335329.1 molybdopterin synthase sulfur carrier subunit-like [Eurytemora carolleeae]XP_023335330.1 molybdopterin synthase sulfur carrier subunit-like [Eurytemora carolleeae]|eukprot:XP_023335327.1 molybdopterin synthase sulfur carrier subunit-like [Eurytemora affinis]